MTDNVIFEIEEGIKIPPRRSRKSEWSILADTMKDGSSILVKTLSQKQSLIYAIKSIEGFGYVTRREEGDYRVWKVKDDR